MSKEREPYALAGNTPLHTEPANRMSGRDGGQGSPTANTPRRKPCTASRPCGRGRLSRAWGSLQAVPLPLFVKVPSRKMPATPNVWLTCPPSRAIRETSTRATAGKFRTAYPPPKAGQVQPWLGAAAYTKLGCNLTKVSTKLIPSGNTYSF